MKQLEDLLQVSLFDRSNRIPELNQLGLALIPKAKDVIHAYETILDDLTGDANLIGELTLGAVPSTIRRLIPESIKRLVSGYPDLHIRVVPGLSGDLQEQVERGALDAAVISTISRVHPNLNWQPFVEEELVLLASADVEANDPKQLLQEMPYIKHTRRAAVGFLAEEWLAANSVKVKPSMEMESLESVSSMVAYGLGVSIVPNVCVPDPVFESLRKIPLGPNANCRILGILTRTDCSKIRLVERLLTEIKATIEAQKPLNSI